MDFQGRTTVVTGAANGIGAALSRRFHAAGANVVLADRDAAPLERVTQELNDIRTGSAIGVVADIGTESGNIALINAARAKFGFIDLFYANAGIGGGTDLESTDEAMWEATFNINLNAHRWAAKHLLGEWLAEGRGYFCSTASAAGLLTQIGSAPYSVTKHGAVAFAEWLSISYGDRGLRVSCLCPQGVNTNLLNPPTTDSASAIAPNASGAIAPNGGDVVKFAGVVLEPSDVAEVVYQAIVDERFLILPHPEVAIYEQRKAADRDRWLAGMRKLQARVFGAV